MIGADLLVSFSKTCLSIFNWFLLYYYSLGTDLIALMFNRQICWRILRHWTFGTLYTHMFFMLACFLMSLFEQAFIAYHVFFSISSGHQESGKGTSIECSAPSPPHGPESSGFVAWNRRIPFHWLAHTWRIPRPRFVGIGPPDVFLVSFYLLI